MLASFKPLPPVFSIAVLLCGPAVAQAPEPAPEAASDGIRGRVTDAKTGEPLIEATVKVVQGGEGQALTDVDGTYVLKLPPGKYELRVFYELYQGRRIQNVVVGEGATRLDVQLTSDAAAVQEVVVEARTDRRAEGGLLQERKRAAVVSDAISAQEIARTPDSTASDAVKRVVSATVVGGRFVLLRGLGGRYATTLLNGALLPSPEPDEPAVPLDIFPTALLANLNVVKSYSADLPGTFAGGALLIETNSYPASFELRPRVIVWGDSIATWKPRQTYQGGGLDWLGFDDGTRALPVSLPRSSPLQAGANGLTQADVTRMAEGFSNNVWSTQRAGGLPNFNVGFSVGDTARTGDRRLGWLGALYYGHRVGVQRSEIARYRIDAGQLAIAEDSSVDRGVEGATLNGLLNGSYQVGPDFELSGLLFYTHTGESFAQNVFGFSDNDQANFQGTRLQFLGRSLAFSQLRGFHRLSGAGDAEIDWQANLSRATRSEPDTRDVTYNQSTSGALDFRSQPGSGERYFSELGENSGGGSVNATFPLSGVRLKTGTSGQYTWRRFDSRRFRYSFQPGADPAVRQLPPEQLFSPPHLGDGIQLEEQTLGADSYDGNLLLLAGYATSDIGLLDPLRIVAGGRVEVGRTQLVPGSVFSITQARTPGVDRTNAAFLPALNLIYAFNPNVNLRLGYSYTLARPTFRELAPYLYFDFVRRRSFSGNPELRDTRIHNVDLRAEWFPAGTEVLALTLFAKRFIDPIETVVVSSAQGDVSVVNAPSANSYGVEAEARVSLGRIAPFLDSFRVGGNASLIRSRIHLGSQQRLQTSRDRAMQGQSPYVVNLSLGWDPRGSGTEVALLYNVVGERITEVGIEGLPDVYERPFHRLDLTATYSFRNAQLKLNVTNLLDQRVRFEQGNSEVLRYGPGLGFSLGLTLSL